MSRSYRTLKRSVIARRNILERKRGKPHLPRIVERKPYHGDSHPIRKDYLRGVLLNLPIEYLFGLTKIELLPRCAEVGRPYGCYRRKEKSILLYSLPMTWAGKCGRHGDAELLRDHWGAQVSFQNDTVTVSWRRSQDREIWFVIMVLLHELGHHYRNQYKARDKRAHYKTEELIANLHWIRLFRRGLRALRASKNVSHTTP